MQLFLSNDPPLSPVIAALASGVCSSIESGRETVLQDGPTRITSPWSICRYLARKAPGKNLYGSNVLQECEIDHWITFSLGPLASPSELDHCLAYLDKTLTPVTYLVGNVVSLADIVVWSSLKSSPAFDSLCAENRVPGNLCRWFAHLSELDFVQKGLEYKPQATAQADNLEKMRKEDAKFVDLPGAEVGKVVVRFPPEASGYLHIGHAKAALLNQYYKEAFNGKLIMRFDDTNPAKEKVDFEKVILEDIKLLKIEPDIYTHTSNYFDLMLDYCEKLLKEGKAYVDDTDPETMKTEREQRIESKNRSNDTSKNVQMWEEMKKGTAKGQKCCVRAKIDMQSANGCMRDPTIYRCKDEPHPKTGFKYKVYPTYDFACPIVDSIEGVTHCLRTMEYHDRDEQFFWFIDALKLRKLHICEYSRLNMTNTVLSKRKLTWFVENGYVDGWDDPRMPTVRGVIRRGMTVEGLKQFIIAQGSSRSVVVMEWDKIWAFNKKVIDPVAPRFTAVENADKVLVKISGVKESLITVSKHPKNPEVGNKTVKLSPEVFIDAADAKVLKENENVTFINWGNIKIKKIVKAGDKITEILAETNLEDKNFKNTTKITWLAKSDDLVPTVCVFFDHIISKPVLGKDEDFKKYIDHRTKLEVQMIGDPELASLKKGDIIQLQRKGFFICDEPAKVSIHTWTKSPIILFSVPDGHSKPMPTAITISNTQEVPKKQVEETNINVTELLKDISRVGDKIRKLKEEKADKNIVTAEVKVLLDLKGQYKLVTGKEWTPNAAQSQPNGVDAKSLSAKITEQGNKIRELKALKAPKGEIDKEVATLLNLKSSYKEVTGKPWAPPANPEKEKNELNMSKQITDQGNKIRDLKAKKAPKNEIDAEVKVLLDLKSQFKELTGNEWKPEANVHSVASNDPVTALSSEITVQGNKVKTLKQKKAPKEEVDQEVKLLLSLKNKYKTIAGKEWAPEQSPPKETPVKASPNHENLNELIINQGNTVRKLKSDKASKEEVQKEINILLELKENYKKETGQDWVPPSDNKPHSTESSQPLSSDHQISDLTNRVKQQGDKVRALKSRNDTPKEDLDAAIGLLLSLKKEYKELTGADFPSEVKPAKGKPKKVDPPKPQSQPQKQSSGAVKKITRLGLEATKEENLPEWYSQVITKGEMIEYYDVSGCYILRPWAFSIWEVLRDWFDSEIKKLGVKNCYFPIFVSRSVLEKEKDHIADFAPEVAWVTKSGESDLAEHIAIRPTSETVMYPAYAKWIQSYRDLPIKLNQWNNVVRWEFKHPQPFLRTREFLWQEGHTAFATIEEAKEEVKVILDLYSRVYTDLLAIPVVKGRKTEKEKFAGGDFTYTVEAYISASGRAIQGATSHHLGQNFSKMFEIVFEDPVTQEKKFVFQNSWGFTTRTIGVMIMVHADNNGLVLPPRVASVQVIIVPCGISVNLTEAEKQELMSACKDLEDKLKSSDVHVQGDYRDNYSPGWKFNHWELKGVPLRVEIGPKDLKAKQVVLIRRDTGDKRTVGLSSCVCEIKNTLEQIHASLYNKAKEDMDSHMAVTKNWAEFCQLLDKKYLLMAPFCGRIDCEDKIKQDSARDDAEVETGAPAMGAKSLCIPFDQPSSILATDKCIHPGCSSDPVFYTLFGRSY